MEKQNITILSGAGISELVFDKPYNMYAYAFRGYTGNVYFTNLAGYKITASGKTSTRYPVFGYVSSKAYSVFTSWTADH